MLCLRELEPDDIPLRLGLLLKDVTQAHGAVLQRHGIELVKLHGGRDIGKNEMSLPTPKGHLCVQVSQESLENPIKAEVEIFRRVACALREIPRTILAKHKASVKVRT